MCVCLCVWVYNCIASCFTPTRDNVSLTSPSSLPISQFAPLYPSPPLRQNTYIKCKQCTAKKKTIFAACFDYRTPLCVSCFSSSSIFFLSNCGKRAPSRILFCSLSVVVAALKQINLANNICCCCGRRISRGSGAAGVSRRRLKHQAELQLYTGCHSLALSHSLSQCCQLHVRMQAINTTKNAIKVKTKERTLRYVTPYLGTAHTVYKDNHGGAATPCVCGLSNTINSPHYATFRNTVIEPPRQLDKSSSNPINNCMQKQ